MPSVHIMMLLGSTNEIASLAIHIYSNVSWKSAASASLSQPSGLQNKPHIMESGEVNITTHCSQLVLSVW